MAWLAIWFFGFLIFGLFFILNSDPEDGWWTLVLAIALAIVWPIPLCVAIYRWLKRR